jgi:hypothetical protein
MSANIEDSAQNQDHHEDNPEQRGDAPDEIAMFAIFILQDSHSVPCHRGVRAGLNVVRFCGCERVDYHLMMPA